MSCKYPENSRSFMFCVGYKDKDCCSSSKLFSEIKMPEVKPPKGEIFSADEARRLTVINEKERYERQLQDIVNEIKGAIENRKRKFFSFNKW